MVKILHNAFIYINKNRYYIVPSVLIIFGVMMLAIFGFGQNQVKKTIVDRKFAERIMQAGERDQPKIPPMPKGEQRNYLAINNKLVPILMYHHIREYTGDNKIEAGLSTSPALFSEQLDWLKEKGFHTITFSDLFTGKVEDKSIILTFDDGYRDNYEVAYKKLKENGQKGDFFVFTGAIGASEAFLTKDMIKEMSDYGMEFGSHTINHVDMSVADKETLATQLSGSKSVLEGITGKKVEFLCYPSGKYNALAEAEAKAAGYKAAVTTRPYADSSNLYEIPRIRMNPGTPTEGLSLSIRGYLLSSDRYSWTF
ncbi:MAG: polysaccharide deacetylase family protein [bacterium]